MRSYLFKTFYSLVFLLVASCNNSSSKMETALNEAGENRKELEKVLDFYSKKPEDSLKYKAAVYLIENMPGHSSYQKLTNFEPFFDSIDKYPNKKAIYQNKRMDYFYKCIKSARYTKDKTIPKLVDDIHVVNSKYLFNTIELAFDAWYNIPKNKRCNFDDFCNFVLPYKTRNEPIEANTRSELSHKYAWVLKDLKRGMSLKTTIDSAKSRFNYHFRMKMSEFYPQPLSISQVENTRIGLCDDGVNYFVNVFRSLGLVSAADRINNWGNQTVGHSWLYVKYGNEEYQMDVTDIGDNIKERYKNESIPKVNRESYFYNNEDLLNRNSKDVTNLYVKTVNLKIKNRFEAPNQLAVLCIFDKENGWKPVCSGKIKESLFCFDNVGCNVLYMAANVTNEKITPINYPFFVEKSGAICYLEPNQSQKNSAILTRKLSLSSPRNHTKIKWLKDLNGAVFQGADNPNFDNAIDLFKIGNINSTQPKTINLHINKKFSHLRFYGQTKDVYISKLAFFDVNHSQITGDTVIKNYSTLSKHDKIFDLSNTLELQFIGGLQHFEIGLKLKKPQKLSAIYWQPRNDNNHINVGETYELFYWDKNWISLGKQIAKDTLLRYKTPKNALLWLKNLTAGKEEQVFIIDKNNRQNWPGSDNY